ncbi:MAG: hypothetical protein LBC73_00910 [Oscillospiraceae bacterium]|jgi:hypothetical protein|nr:hypothetical protein [Oscillospiraceae bacterium]
MGLFKPIWKDDTKARAFIMTTANQSKLAEIVLNSENPSVRLLAAKKLDSPDIIKNILPNLNDQHIVASFAFHFNDDVRKSAIKIITDQSTLAYIITNSLYMDDQKTAINKLTNQNILAEVLKSDFNYTIRSDYSFDFAFATTVLSKVTDQSLIKKIAIESKNTRIRSMARERLDDKSAVSDEYLAKHDADPDTRIASIKKVKDKNVLADIAKNDSIHTVQIAAIKQIQDQTVLADIAKNDIEPDVQKKAVERLQDQAALIDIANRDIHYSVRILAADKLTDPTVTQGIYTDVIKKGLPFHELEYLIRKVTDQEYLAEIALDGYRPSAPLAIKQISDENTIIKVAVEVASNGEKDAYIRNEMANIALKYDLALDIKSIMQNIAEQTKRDIEIAESYPTFD